MSSPSTRPGSAARKPAAKKPAAKKPAARKGVAKKPAAKKPVAAKPSARKPAAKKPAAKKVAAKKPVAKKSAARKPVARKSIAKKPAAKKSPAKKPTTARRVSDSLRAAGKGRATGVGEIIFNRVNELVETGLTAKAAFPLVARELAMSTANVQQHYYRFKRRVGSRAAQTRKSAGVRARNAGMRGVSGAYQAVDVSRKTLERAAELLPDWLELDVDKAIKAAERARSEVGTRVNDVASTVQIDLRVPQVRRGAVGTGVKAVSEVIVSVGGRALVTGVGLVRKPGR